MTEKHKVFVYGTLRAEAKNPALFRMHGMTMYDAGRFPVAGESRYYTIIGQILEVDDKELARLDWYEGVERGLYVRQKLEAWPDKPDNTAEDVQKVWVYTAGPYWDKYPKRFFPEVKEGDWLKWVENRKKD